MRWRWSPDSPLTAICRLSGVHEGPIATVYKFIYLLAELVAIVKISAIKALSAQILQLHGGDFFVERCQRQSPCIFNGSRFVPAFGTCGEERVVDLNTFGPYDGLAPFDHCGRWLEDELDMAYAPIVGVLLR